MISAFGVEHVAKRAPTELFEHAHALRSAGDQPLTNARRTTENFDSKAKMAQGRDGEAIPNPFGTRKVRLVRRQTLDREATAGRKAEMIRGLAKSAFGIEIGKGAEHLAAVASSARKLRRLGFAARELPLPMQPRSAQPWAHTAEEVESSRRRLGIQSHVSAVKAARAEHRANIRTALQAGHSAEEIARVAPRGTGASPAAVKQLARAR